VPEQWVSSGYTEVKPPVKCLVCNTSNPHEASQCRECAAPMALVHDLIAQQREAKIISIVGESNVGKTVYLGFLLDMLAQRAGSFEAIPRGAFSIDLQQTVINYMSHRMFPPKTPMEADRWYWAYYQIRKLIGENKWYDLVMPDMAGESLAAEVATPRTFRVISELAHKSAGLILLVDAAMAANGSAQPDFFSMKMLSYIDAMSTTANENLIQTPTAIVLCKADHCPESFDYPRRFAEANLNRLWNLSQSRFARVEYFAASVVGSLGYATSEADGYVTPIPLHTALRGILEPFQWIIDQV
jgi:hypothetical protein